MTNFTQIDYETSIGIGIVFGFLIGYGITSYIFNISRNKHEK